MNKTYFFALTVSLCGANVFATGEIYMTLDFPGAVNTYPLSIDGGL